MRRAAVSLLVVLAVGAGVVGCGGGSDDVAAEATRYADAVNRVQGRFARGASALARDVSPTSTVAQDRRALAAFDAELRRTADALRAIEPPARAEREHARLAVALDGYGRTVRREARALATGDATTVGRARERLQDATTDVSREVNAAVDAINRSLRS